MSLQRTAVLVDGDNVAAIHAGGIMAAASALGRVDVARVYAAADRPTPWLTAPGFRLIHAGTGKNAADLLLCLDAMELAFVDRIESFAIATSDGDFTHLAQRLRERGHQVLGLGEAKAPAQFRAACRSFIELAPDIPSRLPPSEAIADLDRQIRSMIAKHSRNGEGMRLVELAPKMHQAHGVKISTHPERNWRSYLERRPTLYDLDERGQEAMVRFRPDGFASGSVRRSSNT